MKYDEIIKLLDAGYTRDEILNMDTTPPEENPPEETPPTETPEANEVTNMVKEMRDLVSEMRKEFTAMNILSTQRPPESEKTADEVIANIINPSVRKKGDK